MSVTLEDLQRIMQQSNAAQAPAASTSGTTAAEDLKAFSNYVPVSFGRSNPGGKRRGNNVTPPVQGSPASYGFIPPPQDSIVTQAIENWVNLKTGEKFSTSTGGYTPPNSDWVRGEGLDVGISSPSSTKRRKGSSSGAINVPVLPVESHTPVARVDPTKYEWTGDYEKDQETIEKLRKRYKWEEPEQGTPGYSGMFRGTPGKPHGLGYRNDNPIDYSTQGAGFWSMGIDPNDPALGYHVARFKDKEPENWAWANSEYWANNKRTGNEVVDDATVLDWYWRDLARRMDKSNSFFDSFLGKLFVNIAVGWATAGVGNMFGPWAASLFGGITSGAMNDWDPLSMIMGAVTPQIGNIMDSTGLSGLANDILPDWASLRLPETTQMVTGIDKFGNAVIRDVFDYTLNDALQSAGMTTAKEALSRFQESLSQEQGQGGAEPASLQPGAAPGLTPLPQGYVPPPITPVDPVRFGQGASQPPTNPFDAENNPFNPVTEYAKGGTVRRSIEDMTDNEFIGMRRDDMPGSARRDLDALMAQIGQYAAGGMVPEYGYGGMVPEYADGGMVSEYAEGGMVPEYGDGGMVPEYAEGGEVEEMFQEAPQLAPVQRKAKKPAYLGTRVQGMPGFYNINPNKFNFYQMAAQMDQPGVYTVGAPKLTMYETPEGSGYGVRARPGGKYVSRMPSDNTSAWNTFLGSYNVSPYAPYHGTTTASFEGAIPRTDLRKPALPKEEYNAAMRQLYADLAAEGKPMVAYYNPKFSRNRGRKRTSPLLASQDIV